MCHRAPAAAQAWLLRAALVVGRTQAGLQALLAAAAAAHLSEALLIVRLVQPAGDGQRALWMLQTFLLGFPSMRLLLGAMKT